MTFDVTALGRHPLVDPHGDVQHLDDRWEDDPQVVLFLRHFG